MQDEDSFNKYHIPVWIVMPGHYTWGNKGAGGRQVETGGCEKSNFTVQLY